jgi:galactose-1-phosphate uridylyltransferase
LLDTALSPTPFSPPKSVDFRRIPRDYAAVKVDATKYVKSESELLDQATGQLLRAVKQQMRKKQGRVDCAKLRKDGYSERFLARLVSTI